MTKVILFPFKLAIAIFLPFFVLLRTAVYMHEEYMWNGWLALLTGAGAAALILLIYFTWLQKKIFKKSKITGSSLWNKMKIALGILVLFVGYGILYISADNAKTESIRENYGTLHPVLRMGLSTITLFDSDLVVTDLKREHGDYAQMGMGAVNNSLHFEQKDGFVHAVDLRTRERSEIRNKILEYYFKVMGFNTLRHVGTADHLHVSLMIWEAPGAL